MSFATTSQPSQTPWGAPEAATQLLPGIWEVRTASHGGMMLSDERQAAMPDALRNDRPNYEEDVDWALVVSAFADEFRILRAPLQPAPRRPRPPDGPHLASPNATPRTPGEVVPVNENPTLRRRAAALAAVGELVTTTAWGSWADWVPDGMVGVLAKRVREVDALGFARYSDERVWALVDKAAYAARNEVTLLASLSPQILDGDPMRPETKEFTLD